MTLGPVGKATIEERRREAAVVIDRIKRGEDPKPTKPSPEPTVADLAARCLEAHVAVRCKPNTAKNYRMSLQHHILPALGTKALKDVAPSDISALHHKLRDTPCAANQAVWVLSKMFNLAENWGMMPPGRNPCRHVRYYREKSRERFLTPEEFRRLGAVLKKFEAEGSMLPSANRVMRSRDSPSVGRRNCSTTWCTPSAAMAPISLAILSADPESSMRSPVSVCCAPLPYQTAQ